MRSDGASEQCKIGCCGKIQIYAISLESKSSTQTSHGVDNTFKHDTQTTEEEKRWKFQQNAAAACGVRAS